MLPSAASLIPLGHRNGSTPRTISLHPVMWPASHTHASPCVLGGMCVCRAPHPIKNEVPYYEAWVRAEHLDGPAIKSGRKTLLGNCRGITLPAFRQRSPPDTQCPAQTPAREPVRRGGGGKKPQPHTTVTSVCLMCAMTYRRRGSATKHMGVQYWCAEPQGEKRGPLIQFSSLPQT